MKLESRVAFESWSDAGEAYELRIIISSLFRSFQGVVVVVERSDLAESVNSGTFECYNDDSNSTIKTERKDIRKEARKQLALL